MVSLVLFNIRIVFELYGSMPESQTNCPAAAGGNVGVGRGKTTLPTPSTHESVKPLMRSVRLPSLSTQTQQNGCEFVGLIKPGRVSGHDKTKQNLLFKNTFSKIHFIARKNTIKKK